MQTEYVVICDPEDWPDRFERFKQQTINPLNNQEVEGNSGICVKSICHDGDAHYIALERIFWD